MSSTDNESEAGPSRSPPPTINEAEGKKRQGQGQGRKRKAGGDGKKGKIFLEDKAGLLSLMANVTGDKDSVAQTKLENQRRRNPDTAPVEEVAKVTSTSSANNNKAKLRKDKKKDRGKALREAKAALVKEAKDKKKVKKGQPIGGDTQHEAPGKPKKKSVGFA